MAKILLPDNDVVMTSRIRLARNFTDLPFNTGQSDNIATACVDRVEKAILDSEDKDEYIFFSMEDFSDVEQTSLMEDHLISRELMGHNKGALALKKNKKVALMINEEDHIRLQVMEPGSRLSEAAKEAFRLEDILQKSLDFAYDESLGYLTACPTNTGTGMRASLMLHLPMLSIFKQMGMVNQAVAKLGLTIRGMYGEGSESLGNIFQVSNQITLGKTEDEIIAAVEAVGKQIISMERDLRNKAYEQNKVFAEDKILRSYGILSQARILNNEEFMEHWSNIRVGAVLGIIPLSCEKVDELISIAQDAHVKSRKNGDRSQLGWLDTERATQVREFLAHATQNTKEEID